VRAGALICYAVKRTSCTGTAEMNRMRQCEMEISSKSDLASLPPPRRRLLRSVGPPVREVYLDGTCRRLTRRDLVWQWTACVSAHLAPEGVEFLSSERLRKDVRPVGVAGYPLQPTAAIIEPIAVIYSMEPIFIES
jgi:hypothetical protein